MFVANLLSTFRHRETDVIRQAWSLSIWSLYSRNRVLGSETWFCIPSHMRYFSWCPASVSGAEDLESFFSKSSPADWDAACPCSRSWSSGATDLVQPPHFTLEKLRPGKAKLETQVQSPDVPATWSVVLSRVLCHCHSVWFLFPWLVLKDF